jgi:hypothetical protein
MAQDSLISDYLQLIVSPRRSPIELSLSKADVGALNTTSAP